MKRILRNNIASGFGVLAILVPVVMAVILTFVGGFIGTKSDLNIVSYTDVPSGYDSWTEDERATYLIRLHGADNSTYYDRWWRLTHIRSEGWFPLPLAVPFFDEINNIVIVFDDGTIMSEGEFREYKRGDANGVSLADLPGMVLSVLTLNVPLLNSLGTAGSLIKVLCYISVIAGVVEITMI